MGMYERTPMEFGDFIKSFWSWMSILFWPTSVSGVLALLLMRQVVTLSGSGTAFLDWSFDGGFTFADDKPFANAAYGGLIRDMRDRRGVTVLLVEHHMSLVMSVSDWIVALNFGRKIAEGTPEQIQKHPEVIRAYLGGA